MANVVLPYVNTYQARRKKYAYYRRHGVRLRIAGEIGSPEFLKSYQEIHNRFEQSERPRPGIIPGSLAELIARYRGTPEWTQLKPSTRKDYEKFLQPLEDDFGMALVSDLDRAAVRLVRDRYAFRPGRTEGDDPIPSPRRANKTVSMLSILMSYAIEIGMRSDNPALRPKRLKTGPGYRAWTRDEIQTFLREKPQFRLPLLLALGTGQRGIDQIAMTWSAFDGDVIEVVQEKTGAKVWIPCHPELKDVLEREMTLRTADTILTSSTGRPWELGQFQSAVSKAIRSAGLNGIVWHGLRATAASWLAEMGCTEREIMAITGHTTAASVSVYVRHAEQKTRAVNAIAKLSNRALEQRQEKRGVTNISKQGKKND
ncbi:tyrosine-type recombinase/integrase [Komagataeibacter oboediens]|uniref:Tyrosine-type recombinase/integrase n=1 Tax=Komagataeibacter oboediens TaxID=65958 RepID=A0ABS5SR03_9PROT|nr:site-specific integrase [Komagataeibacter oboediens]MBT0676648.1 tyrosine-type recombinase/integrase [Komagataeibacter oboediens]MBT0678173.1 tyrosine-type recombinase/integrase [Komagataeibacter oboediens]